MKSNPALQATLRCQNPAQKAWYAANVLMAALTSSPAVFVRAAVPAIPAKPAILAQTAKPARAATAAVAASANTTGYAFGELYLNSPAYLAGTAIPAIPAKPASAAVVGVPAVVAVPAVTAVTSPAVVAIKGYEDAIKVVKTAELITVTAELPVAQGVSIVGSDILKLLEISPSALQANAWIDTTARPPLTTGVDAPTGDVATDTLEEYFFKHAIECEHTILPIVRNVAGVPTSCLRLTVTLYPLAGFDPDNDSLQLPKIWHAANVGS